MRAEKGELSKVGSDFQVWYGRFEEPERSEDSREPGATNPENRARWQ